MNSRAFLLSLLVFLNVPVVFAATTGAPSLNSTVPSDGAHGPTRVYDQLLIDEVVITFDGTDSGELREEHIQRLKAAAAQAVHAAVGARLPVVAEPGPGVLRVRAALSQVRIVEKPRRFLSYTPLGIFKRWIDVTTGRNFILVSATAEIEIVDALNGATLAAATDPTAAVPVPGGKDKPSFRTAITKLGGLTHRLVLPLLAAAPQP